MNIEMKTSKFHFKKNINLNVLKTIVVFYNTHGTFQYEFLGNLASFITTFLRFHSTHYLKVTSVVYIYMREKLSEERDRQRENFDF